MVWRLLWGAIRLVIALAILAVVAGAYLFWRAMPTYSGSETLPGLSAEVHVWRDSYGVPHIFAPSMDDAARALGYLHASERLFQMEYQRRIGQGRLAEVLGAEGLDVDKFIRTLGFYREAESSFSALSPWAQKRLQAYADGVNAFLDIHKSALPPEFLIAGVTPDPWKPADSLVWGKVMALQLSNNYALEALRVRLREKLGPEQAKWMFPGQKPGDPITTLPTLNPTHASGGSIENEIGALTGLGRGASNEWVVAGSRTVTGKPILANDPHLGLGAPILWYLARIVTPEGSVKGATAPGAPGVLLGQNDKIAWGFTTADTDVQDLFVETVDPSDPSRYLTPDGPKPFETRVETIRVKDAPDVELMIRTTRHGPILSDVSKDVGAITGPGQAIALAYTGLGDRDTTEEAILRLNVAQSWNEFLDAMRIYQNSDAEYRLCGRLRGYWLFKPRPRAAAQVRRWSCSGRRRVRRVRLDRRRPVRTVAAAAQPGDRLRLQRQQRQCRRRPPADFRPGLGGDLPRPPHPAILRHDRQAQPRDVSRHASRPPVAGRPGDAAVHRNDRAI